MRVRLNICLSAKSENAGSPASSPNFYCRYINSRHQYTQNYFLFFSILNFIAHEFRKFGQAGGIAPFVVIPRADFHQIALGHGQARVHN